jgi:hypothetical protein
MAKKLLHDDIVAERTKKFRGPTGIYNSRPEFKKYPFKNFSSNYYSLRKAIQGRITLRNAALTAYRRDLQRIRANRPAFHYNGSVIEAQLRSDVQRGYTDGKTPSEVFGSRRVFKESRLPLIKFSNFLSFERRRHEKMLHEGEYRRRMQFITTRIGTDDSDNDD